MPTSQQALIRQALACLREQLQPSLSARQRQSAAHIEACLQAADLQSALGRLDECISGGLRGGRLSLESRHYLRRELARTSRLLQAGEPAAGA